MYNPEFTFAIGFDIADHMETCKGESMTIPHQGVSIEEIMNRANSGLPINVSSGVPLDAQNESFNTPVNYFADSIEEFDYYSEKLAELERYRDELKAQQEQASESDDKPSETNDSAINE